MIFFEQLLQNTARKNLYSKNNLTFTDKSICFRMSKRIIYSFFLLCHVNLCKKNTGLYYCVFYERALFKFKSLFSRFRLSPCGGGHYFTNTNFLSCTSIFIVSPLPKSPSSNFTDKGFSTNCWIVRFSGRAP